MSTIASTAPQQQPRHALRAPIDPTWANFVGLISAAALLLAFLFAPWYWGEVKYNGARLMSEVLVDRPYGQYTSAMIILIPLAALGTVLITLWGLNSPERGKLASFGTSLFGLIALFYFLDFYVLQDNELIDQYVQTSSGFTIALVAAVVLLGQAVLLHPWINEGLFRLSETGSARLPAVPAWLIPYLFLVVPLALYVVWIIAPTIYTFYLSLTDWDGVSSPRYIGLKNYKDLFAHRSFTEALSNNVRWLAVFITVPTTLGLALALIFNTEMRGGKWYKVSFYSPLVLSGPVIALVWSWVYHPSKGLINPLLVDSGITSSPPGWLADRQIAIYCIIVAAAWRQVGYVMVLYLAGLKNIDPTLLDAGLVDGTNRWQLFRYIIFPLLAPVTAIIVIISIIDSLRAFDLVQIMTRGNQNTEVLANLMYMEAFNNYRMGYGGAIAVILFSISVVFVGLYLWRTLKDELEY